MPKDSDSKPNQSQSTTDKPSLSEKTTSEKKPSHLKLVVSNPDSAQDKAPAPSESAPSNAGFTAGVRNIGPQIYEMNIQDPFHDLKCNLFLDIETDRGEMAVVCHFPNILNESNQFLEEDEMLYGVIMVQFQMKILEQLFLFCGDHEASRLMIYMDDAPAEGFEIYHHFLAHQDRNLTTDGEQTTMVISVNVETLDRLRSFMTENNLKLEQGLWREQRFNPAIRQYLKLSSCLCSSVG